MFGIKLILGWFITERYISIWVWLVNEISRKRNVVLCKPVVFNVSLFVCDILIFRYLIAKFNLLRKYFSNDLFKSAFKWLRYNKPYKIEGWAHYHWRWLLKHHFLKRNAQKMFFANSNLLDFSPLYWFHLFNFQSHWWVGKRFYLLVYMAFQNTDKKFLKKWNSPKELIMKT